MRRWNKLFRMPDSSDQVMRREQWTRDIVRLMFIVVMIATGVILLGVFAGILPFCRYDPHLCHFPLHNGRLHRRATSWLDLGKVFTRSDLFGYRTLLFLRKRISRIPDYSMHWQYYSPECCLASRSSWFVAFLAISGYSLLGANFHSVEIYTELPAIVTTFFLLLGITFLLTYFDNSLNTGNF